VNILITNDDGFDAPGLRALFSTAKTLGQVTVVAPLRGQSMSGQAITTNNPIGVEKRKNDNFGQHYVCDGTPTDCVRLALKYLPLDSFDLVLSGINYGANAGVDVYYSGTVAAAREAAFGGLPALAVSQLIKPTWSDNWQRSTDLALQAIKEVINKPNFLQTPSLVNINLPDLPSDSQPQGIITCPLTTDPLAVEFTANQDEAIFSADYFARPAPEGSDFHYLINDWITVTPLLLDSTDHANI